MAEKKNTSKPRPSASSAKASPSKVTIKKSVSSDTKSSKSTKKPKQKRSFQLPGFLGFLRPIGAYFGGAWYELRQVRWPDRKASWSLTLAVILFSLFFAGLILGLDFLFQLLFKQILL